MFTYIYHKNPPNVDKHTINGWYGEWRCQIFHHFSSERMLTEMDSRIKKLHLAIQNPKRMGKFRKSDSILRRNGHIVAVYFCLGVLAPISNKHTLPPKKSVTCVCACCIGTLGIRTENLRTKKDLFCSELFVIQRAVGSFVLRWQPWSALVLHARPRVNQKWTWRLRCVQPFQWRSSYHRKRCRNRAIWNSWRW